MLPPVHPHWRLFQRWEVFYKRRPSMLSRRPAMSIRIAAMTAAVLAVVTPSLAQPAGPTAATAAAPAYAMSVWASEKGLPPGDVFAVSQDAEGYLWLGTPTGLLRFDGSRFTSWAALNDKEPLPNGPVHAIVSAHDGSLWV